MLRWEIRRCALADLECVGVTPMSERPGRVLLVPPHWEHSATSLCGVINPLGTKGPDMSSATDILPTCS